MALAIAFNPGVTYRCTVQGCKSNIVFNVRFSPECNEPFFMQAWPKQCSRARIGIAMSLLRQELEDAIKAIVGGGNVVLAVDGWTSVRHRKFFNLMMIFENKPIFLQRGAVVYF